MYNIRFYFTSFLILLFFSCRVPRNTVLLFNNDNNFSKKAFKRIPAIWDGRLLAQSHHPGLGGEAIHSHNYMHDHTDTSEATNSSFRPLGLQNPTVSADHLHMVATYLQSPQFSGPAVYEVRSKELTAYINRRGRSKIPIGLIVLYIGTQVPNGWKACDGTGDSPDLRGVYIRLRQLNCAPTASGSSVHHHDVTHGHKWSVLPPDPNNNRNKALAVDEVVYDSDTVTLNMFTHIHGVKETPMDATSTKAQDFFPPSLYVGFIQAGTNVRKMPKGAILATVNRDQPWGWTPWTPQKSADSVLFLYGTSDPANNQKFFGSATHRHDYYHVHNVKLSAFPHQVQMASKHEGPAIARAYHEHAVELTASGKTEASASLPLYIGLHFIIKK